MNRNSVSNSFAAEQHQSAIPISEERLHRSELCTMGNEISKDIEKLQRAKDEKVEGGIIDFSLQ